MRKPLPEEFEITKTESPTVQQSIPFTRFLDAPLRGVRIGLLDKEVRAHNNRYDQDAVQRMARKPWADYLARACPSRISYPRVAVMQSE